MQNTFLKFGLIYILDDSLVFYFVLVIRYSHCMTITLQCPMVHHQGSELTRFQHLWKWKNFVAQLQCFSPQILLFMLDNVHKNECIIYLVQNLYTQPFWLYQCCLFLSLSLHFISENQEMPLKDKILYIKKIVCIESN